MSCDIIEKRYIRRLAIIHPSAVTIRNTSGGNASNNNKENMICQIIGGCKKVNQQNEKKTSRH